MAYVEINESEVPANILWTVPGANQGQHVEVAYGCTSKRREAGPGDPFKRIADQAITGTARRSGEGVAFYKLVKAS